YARSPQLAATLVRRTSALDVVAGAFDPAFLAFDALAATRLIVAAGGEDRDVVRVLRGARAFGRHHRRLHDRRRRTQRLAARGEGLTIPHDFFFGRMTPAAGCE